MHDNSNIILSHQFADFDTSMLIKQIGFNEPCLRYYDKDGRQCQSVCITQYQYNEQVCSAPLWSQVDTFLRTKLNLTQIEGVYHKQLKERVKLQHQEEIIEAHG